MQFHTVEYGILVRGIWKMWSIIAKTICLVKEVCNFLRRIQEIIERMREIIKRIRESIGKI